MNLLKLEQYLNVLPGYFLEPNYVIKAKKAMLLTQIR